ncbi:MAG: hypothetical protein WKG03_00390 [Telluria sp.]
MKRKDRNVINLFSDSEEIAQELNFLAEELGGNYWLKEAEVHILGLYGDACYMQRTIAKLRAKIAALEGAK